MIETRKEVLIEKKLVLTREIVLEELRHFPQYLDLDSFTDSQLFEYFNNHCQSFSEEVSIIDIWNNYSDKDFLVHTPDGYQEVGMFVKKKERPIHSIKTNKGKEVKISNDHLFESIGNNKKNEWKRTDKLKTGDFILSDTGYDMVVENTIVSHEEVYDWEILHPNHRYYVDGLSSHNTGKTFLCLNIIKEAQAMGYDIIYCDTEGAIDRKQVKKFGVDANRVRYQPLKTISDFKVFISNFVDLITKAKKNGSAPKVMIVVDSLGMLTTEKSVTDALKGKTASDMGLRSKEMRDVFRNITLDLTGLKVPLICTNHTTMAGIGGYIQTKEAAGGDGPIFSMSNVILLSKANLKEDDKKTGIIVTSTFKKARFTRPYPIKFHISFMNGMNPYVGLEEFVSWEACGVQRGKLEVDKKTGEMKFTAVDSSPNWAVAHLGKTVPSKRLFTPEVFTEEVLRNLDENVIKKHFLLPDLVNEADIEGLFDDEEVDESESETENELFNEQEQD